MWSNHSRVFTLEQLFYDVKMRNDERITVAMGESLRRNGYAGSAIKKVLESSGAPNGSLYHHFPGGKRDVAASALRQMGAAYLQLVGGLLAVDGALPDIIMSAFDEAADDIERSGWINMCPVGTVAGEVADAEPALREVAAEVFTSWIEAGTALFATRGMSDTDARTWRSRSSARWKVPSSSPGRCDRGTRFARRDDRRQRWPRG